MTLLRALFRRNFGLALALLALAMLARAAVPQGWMPDAGQDTIMVRLCTAAGAVEMPLPGHPEAPPKHDREQPPCAFSALAFAATSPAEAVPRLPLPPAVAEQYRQVHARFALAQAARQMPPSRAPPAKA